jgi:selenocysteine lyase/cysteine desulfurase
MVNIFGRLIRQLKRLVDIGCVNAIIIVDAALLVLISIDLIRFKQTGHALSATFPLVRRSVTPANVLTAIAVTTTIVFLPSLIVAASILSSRTGPRAGTGIWKSTRYARVVHVATATFIGLAHFVLVGAQQLSGYAFTSQLEWNYRPFTEAVIVRPIVFVLGSWIVYVVVPLIPWVTRVAFTEAKVRHWVKNVGRLIDFCAPQSELFVGFSRIVANFNVAAIAPELDYIKRRTGELLLQYYREVPSGERATEYIREMSNECRELLNRLFFGSHPLVVEENEKLIEFYPSTGRALETALVRMKGVDVVVLSPYEHPTERRVVDWHCLCRGEGTPRAEMLSFSKDQFDWPREKQLNFIVDEFCKYADSTTGKVLLVISDVAYSTGREVPAREIVARVRTQVGSDRVLAVVDGAQAVANREQLTVVKGLDQYVFSAHKWLFSPEPCGVLLSPRAVAAVGRAYDAWSEGLPASVGSARTIASFKAALELILELGLEKVWGQSRALRDRFCAQVRSMNGKVYVVGEQSKLPMTNMVTVAPATGHEWSEDEFGLIRHFSHSRVVPSLVSGYGSLWVRVSFPYFLELREVDRVAKAIDAAVRS